MLGETAQAIRRAEADGVVPGTPPLTVGGFSSTRIIGMLQRLASLFDAEDACYLEVGVFQGLTLLSVASACPGFPCHGIDNFALDVEGENRAVLSEHTGKLRLANVQVIEEDYEDALERLGEHIGSRRVGVYFVDGPHDYRSQLMCLELALPFLHDHAVVVVDDANYRHVRQANRDFLVTHPRFRLLFDAYTPCHPANATDGERELLREGWWNVVNVMVADPDGQAARMFPPTERDRRLYENDHLVHTSRLAPDAPEVLDLVEELGGRSVATAASAVNRLRSISRSSRQRAAYPQLNTYTDELAGSRYNREACSSTDTDP